MGTVKAPMPQVSDGQQSRLPEGFQPEEFLGGLEPPHFRIPVPNCEEA